MRLSHLRLATAIIVGVLVAACASAPTPTPATAPPAASAALPTVAPTVSAAVALEPSAGPTPTQTPTPTRSPFDPTSANWTRLGSAPDVDIAVGFAGGYAAIAIRPYDPAVAWFSADGTTWSSTPLTDLVPNCPGWGPVGDDPVTDAVVRAIATNGREVVIVGEIVDYAGILCGNVRPIAWHSADGRAWQRSEPFPGDGSPDRAEAVWSISGGWRALTENAVWQSADGLAWQQIGERLKGIEMMAGAPDGTLLASFNTERRWPHAFLTSKTGRDWTNVDVPDNCVGAGPIVAPAQAGLDVWVLVRFPRLCWSDDLVTWSTVKVTEWVQGVAQTRFGAIAYGDACFGGGATCKPDPRAWFLTERGTWTPMRHPSPASTFWGHQRVVDGPAGVLLFGYTGKQLRGIVWRLDP